MKNEVKHVLTDTLIISNGKRIEAGISFKETDAPPIRKWTNKVCEFSTGEILELSIEAINHYTS